MPNHPVRRRSTRRASSTRRSARKGAIVCVLIIGVIAAALGAWWWADRWQEHPEEAVVAPMPLQPEAAPFTGQLVPARDEQGSRHVYPYSVIPGGVSSPQDFAAAVSEDASVAEHYGDVTPAALHVEVVTKPRAAYMSYRRDGKIYWTKHKLALHAGERVLTDGRVTVRGRCGNRLSEVPKSPTSDGEPTAEAFDRPDPLFSVAPRNVPTQIPSGRVPDSLVAGLPPTGFGGPNTLYSIAPGPVAPLGLIQPVAPGGVPGMVQPLPLNGIIRGDRVPSDTVGGPITTPPGTQGGVDVPGGPTNPPGDDQPPSGGSPNGPTPGTPGGVDTPGGPGTPDGPGTPGGRGGPGGYVPPPNGDTPTPPKSSVPEPATLTLLVPAVVWAARRRYRRQ